MFLLDSDHLSLLQRQRGDAYNRLATRIQRISETELYIPIIAFHERVKGWNAYLACVKKVSGDPFGWSSRFVAMERWLTLHDAP